MWDSGDAPFVLFIFSFNYFSFNSSDLTSPRLRVSGSPRLPVPASLTLPVAPNGFAFFDERLNSFVGIFRLHQFMQVDVLYFCKRCID